MIVNASAPEFSEVGIPNFPYSKPFIHQYQFFVNRNKDIILKSPTASGKTYAFLFSFINDYLDAKKSNERIKCLYLAPTRLLMHSQLRNLAKTLDQFNISYKILESGYTYAELFKHLWENDFIISSPDIIFYILLRKRKTQHIRFLYGQFIDSLYSIVFDELHLFSTYTLFNIKNLVKIMKKQKKNLHIYLLSATIELKDVINPSGFFLIDGISNTNEVAVSGQAFDYFQHENLVKFLKENDFLENTVYVCNSVDRAKKLHLYFKNSALLVGKVWYEPSKFTRDEQIRENLDKCRDGALTFTTTVFRQGIDVDIRRLITEEPYNQQDAIQTFGRCGRHGRSEFIMLTNKSPLLSKLNSTERTTRRKFEELLTMYFRPQEYEKLKRMMNAMWYKLYTTSRLKEYVEIVVTEQVKKDFVEFKDFLPDLGFREPAPSVKYGDLSISLFEILEFKDAYKNIFRSEDSFFIGELEDGGKFTRREYKRASKENMPVFTLLDKKRYEKTEYYNLTLKLRDIQFKINAKIGPPEKYKYTFMENKLIPIPSSFEPINFFE